MTYNRFRLLDSNTDDDDDEKSCGGQLSSSGGGKTMRLIVPLQGVVQGRGGLVLGSVIPCALFYFLQLYLKRNRSPAPPTPSPSPSSGQLSELTGIQRTPSRSHLSQRGAASPAYVSSRASSILKYGDSLYYAGLKKFMADPYDAEGNPNGVIQLGLAENKLSLDLIRDWLVEHLNSSSHGVELSISGIATYQPFDGLMKLKVVSTKH